jgi:hypothetical protein
MTVQIPDWLWENIAWMTVATGGVGYGTYLIKRKKQLEKGRPERRNQDILIERLIDQNQEQNDRFMAAYKENAGALNGALNAIRALAQEIIILAGSQKTLGFDLKNGIDRIHERVDILTKGKI